MENRRLNKYDDAKQDFVYIIVLKKLNKFLLARKAKEICKK